MATVQSDLNHLREQYEYKEADVVQDRYACTGNGHRGIAGGLTVISEPDVVLSARITSNYLGKCW